MGAYVPAAALVVIVIAFYSPSCNVYVYIVLLKCVDVGYCTGDIITIDVLYETVGFATSYHNYFYMCPIVGSVCWLCNGDSIPCATG